MSAAELADRLDAVRQGNALIRTKLEVRSLDGGKRVLQLQIKQRRTKTATDLVYQVLWPNEHQGRSRDPAPGPGRTRKARSSFRNQPVRTIKARK